MRARKEWPPDLAWRDAPIFATHTQFGFMFFFSCRVIAYLFAHDDVNAQRERKTIEHFYLARREPSHWPAKYVNPSMRPEPTTGQPRRMVDIV